MVRAARTDFGDGLQNNSNRHISSSGYNKSNKSNSEYIATGRTRSDDTEVQILGKKHSSKRGSIEISQAANVHSNYTKFATEDKNNFAVPGKKLKVIFASSHCIKKDTVNQA
jgi:hypothetical protein